jgi:hypothetical protein
MCVSLRIERSFRKKLTVAQLVKSLRRLYPAVHFHTTKVPSAGLCLAHFSAVHTVHLIYSESL